MVLEKREFFGTQQYFKRETDKRRADLRRHERDLADIDKDDHAIRVRQLRKSVIQGLQLTVCSYSAGECLADVDAEYLKILDAVESLVATPTYYPFDLSDRECYFYVIGLIALGRLLDAPAARIASLHDLGRSNQDDFLISYLIDDEQPLENLPQTLLHEEPFGALRRLILVSDFNERMDAVFAYLEGFRALMDEMPWAEGHLALDGRFFGYWAFELGALAKLLPVPDAFFEHQMYYPRDLVPSVPIFEPPEPLEATYGQDFEITLPEGFPGTTPPA